MRGFGAIEEAVKRAEERAGTDGGKEFNFFSWKNTPSRTLRFLDDMPYVVGSHGFVLCKDGNRRSFICPESLDESEGFVKADCPICATVTRANKDGKQVPVKPSEQTIGWAVDREVSDRGKTIKDVLYTVKEDGKADRELPFVGLVKQANSNFWQNLMAFYSRYGTIIDRDFEVKREGQKLDTKYMFVPWDPTDMTTQEEIDARYEEAKSVVTSPFEYIKIFSSVTLIEKHLPSGGSAGITEDDIREAPSVNSSEEIEKPSFESLSDRLKSYRPSDD